MARRTSKPIWEQRRWVAFAILALLLLVSTAASAQTTTTKTNQTFDFGPHTVKNPCNEDMVTVNGKQHVMASQQVQKNTRIHVQTMDNKHGTGLGTPSGKKYSYGDNFKSNVIVPAPPDDTKPTIITRQRIRIVSEGSSPTPDNFFATFTTKIHRNGNASTDPPTFECRGQGKEPAPTP